jgi:glycosyltransferase involved in cell wall biosynthesis
MMKFIEMNTTKKKTPLKTIIIHSHLDGRGGSQRYVLEIAENLKKLGCKPDIFAYEYNKLKCYPELVTGLNIYSLVSNSNNNDINKESLSFQVEIKKQFKKSFLYNLFILFGVDYVLESYRNMKIAKKLTQLILTIQNEKKIKYDIIFAHEEPLSIWTAIELKKKTKMPLYWFCYDTIEKWFIDWKSKKIYQNWFRKLLLQKLFFLNDIYKVRKYVDKIAVLDQNMQKRVERLYKITPKIRRGGISSNLIDQACNSNYLNEKYQVSVNKTIISTVSRFVEYRRIHDILAMFESLDKQLQREIFIYINAPITNMRYYHHCLSEFDDLLKNNPNIVIDLNYPASDKELYGIYNSTDIFIFPNEKQTWGHAPLEAIAFNAVSVISDGAGISEVFSGISPTIYQKGNIRELKIIVEKLIRNRELRQKYAAQQKEYLKANLSWEKICSIYLDDFDKLIIKK